MSDKDQDLELYKLDQSHGFEARKEYARQVHDYTLQYEKHLKEWGQTALRTIFLLNGGAIIALLTFIGGTIGKSTGTTSVFPALFVPAFHKYVFGLGCTALSMVCAYINYSYHQTTASPGDLVSFMVRPQEKWPGNSTTWNRFGMRGSWMLALVCGTGALGFFMWGCFEVAGVFERMK
jgi:hypothetical protein